MRLVSTLVLALGITGCQSAPAPEETGPADGMTYEVTFTGTWTAQNHPLEYPAAGVLTGPHFSGFIGATHNGDFQLYKEGQAPSMGLETLSETGKHSPLDLEIRKAIADGHAAAWFATDPIRDFSKSVSATFKIGKTHPMVSAVAMIAPSPDWFAGVSSVSLWENGGWVESKTMEILAHDSGGDDGATYTAADMDTNPKKPTTLNASAHFMKDGNRIPVGTVTFKMKK